MLLVRICKILHFNANIFPFWAFNSSLIYLKSWPGIPGIYSNFSAKREGKFGGISRKFPDRNPTSNRDINNAAKIWRGGKSGIPDSDLETTDSGQIWLLTCVMCMLKEEGLEAFKADKSSQTFKLSSLSISTSMFKTHAYSSPYPYLSFSQFSNAAKVNQKCDYQYSTHKHNTSYKNNNC